ncbi:hypothetical protein [Prevotella denticola]|uniref:hypothetical protein n=1 Tax=Prevotella denticola TaxID=28129 RepID=UPI0028EC994C|nr:hypothetical protein [Prevotella denticola]
MFAKIRFSLEIVSFCTVFFWKGVLKPCSNLAYLRDMEKGGSSVKCVDWRIKAYALAGYDCPKPDGLKKEDELKDKMQERQIDTMPDHQPVFPSSTDNLFPYHRCL